MKRFNFVIGLVAFVVMALGPSAEGQMSAQSFVYQLVVASFHISSRPESISTQLFHIPKVVSAEQNYPNPFNSSTTIEYSLSQEAVVYITVYNVFGHRVRTLINEVGSPGHHLVSWDGRNDEGELVASGVYFYQFVADDFFATRKMLLLK